MCRYVSLPYTSVCDTINIIHFRQTRNFWDSCTVVYFLFGKLPFQSNVVCISHILLRVIILIDRPTQKLRRHFFNVFRNIKMTGNRSGIQASGPRTSNRNSQHNQGSRAQPGHVKGPQTINKRIYQTAITGRRFAVHSSETMTGSEE